MTRGVLYQKSKRQFFPNINFIPSQVGSPAFRVLTTPDTGATVTLMSYQTAVCHNVNINTWKTVHLFNASGSKLCVDGIAKMKVNKNDIFAGIDVDVSSDVVMSPVMCGGSRMLPFRVAPSGF